jgi:hypothetical protein
MMHGQKNSKKACYIQCKEIISDVWFTSRGPHYPHCKMSKSVQLVKQIKDKNSEGSGYALIGVVAWHPPGRLTKCHTKKGNVRIILILRSFA